MEPKDVCLQCGQTKASQREYSYCAVASGYEYVEVDYDFERHHWRDNSDSMLKSAGILPEYYHLYRRTLQSNLEYVSCNHTYKGHIYWESKEKADYMWMSFDECICCGYDRTKGVDDER